MTQRQGSTTCSAGLCGRRQRSVLRTAPTGHITRKASPWDAARARGPSGICDRRWARACGPSLCSSRCPEHPPSASPVGPASILPLLAPSSPSPALWLRSRNGNNHGDTETIYFGACSPGAPALRTWSQQPPPRGTDSLKASKLFSIYCLPPRAHLSSPLPYAEPTAAPWQGERRVNSTKKANPLAVSRAAKKQN